MSKRNKTRGNNVKADNKQTLSVKDVATVKASELQPKAEAAAAPTPTRKAGTIKLLRTDVNYKGNREAWFNRLREYDGRPLDDFLASAKESPPALTRNNTPEPPAGWVGFFKRERVLAVV